MIQPRNDYLLVRRIDPPQGRIIVTDPDKGIMGEVLAVGPGKWVDGERRQLMVRPGMTVCFNSKWNDFASDHYDDLPLGADKHLHLIQEGDIIGIVG